MTTLLLGSSGKIGSYLAKKFYNNCIPTYYKKKISKGVKFNIIKDDLNLLLENKKIKNVIILAAISDPDECYKFKKKSYIINVKSIKKIINKIVKKNLYFIFFSTEFVYDGKKGNFSETSKVNPLNIYGKQKLLIEKYIKSKTNKCAIFRISKTYGDNLEDKSFLSNYFVSLIKGERFFSLANDQKFNPLFVDDLYKILKVFLNKEIKGVYNIGGQEKISRFQLIKKVSNYLKKDIKKTIELKKIPLSKFNFFDKRPLNVTMNISKLKKKINFKMSNLNQILKLIIIKNKINEKILSRRHKG